MNSKRKTPPGIALLRRVRGRNWSPKTFRYAILFITFIAYACYHASRKPSSIVKSVLHPDSSTKPPQEHNSDKIYPWPMGNVFVKREIGDIDEVLLHRKSKGWEPFNGKDGTSRLGEIDVAFLACYSIGMYVAGHLGDSLDLRLFLTWGMIGSGFFVGLFGWPSVVAVVGNWFGKRKRGLIMGIWNAHTSVGNICGSLIAAGVLEYGWGWSFIAPGFVMSLGGVLVYLFLAAYPEDVGFPDINSNSGKFIKRKRDVEEEEEEVEEDLGTDVEGDGEGSSGSACMIPGVIPFALCLFFSKLVAYTFLYWLPFYLSQTTIGGEYVSVKTAGNLSTLFDVGGIVGGILCGYISDKFKARATTAAAFMYAAIPAMLVYHSYGGVSQTVNILLMMVAGLFVNGPYALITTAVSADLGTHKSLQGDSRALATVTAIIDGTGSAGAALGPLLTGFLSTLGWQAVFYMLVVGALCAGLLLTRLVIAEIREKLGYVDEEGK
ncbi:putative glycerol-3-phosphate transporter 4 [Arabidopsis thaliana]